MTDLWIENGTKSKSTGLIIAPENFELRRDVVLIDTGVTLRKGKAFFTYAEVEALRKQNQLPKGWELPTYEEAEALLEEFVEKSDNTSHGFVNKLKLDFSGYVYPKMQRYNEDPSAAAYETIDGNYLEGRFWVENPDKNSLYAIFVRRHGLPKLQTFCAESGAKIRLVRQIS